MTITSFSGVQMNTDADGSHEENARIVYDQRQSGKYNIHVVIKDVAIIEMGQNDFQDNTYNEDDYYYDENDLTVKPITLNPQTTSIAPQLTTTTVKTIKDNNATTPSKDQQHKNSTPSNNEAANIISLSDQRLGVEDETTLNSNIIWNTLTSLITGKPTMTGDAPTTTKPSTIESAPASNIEVKPRCKIEPIFANEDYAKFRDDAIPLRNSKIYKLKIHRSHQPLPPTSKKLQARRCRSNQSRNVNGNCGNKRSTSGSLLHRLFSMLVTLPVVRGEQQRQQHNDD
ncbi:uncharacterized protein [Musca autumnalis]|uniref:uncharacterized protein n=1 Tax=Musca autumnalis TaxID=221902 RepID=UPI003CE8E8E6